ncbi:MAG: choice-of-anchor E domain-containing protein [Chitinophagaceae bacterium]|nr:choice-of-anchor E domain-containing protein [Chitinophagaceae bacterium]
MKHFYLRHFIRATLLTAGIFAGVKGSAQCPGGYVPSGVAFDTTLSFANGNVSSTIKFPKFDPTVGMVTCARLTMTIVSTLNMMRVENESPVSTTANALFTRRDTIKGPGLSSSGLLNSESTTYGPYSLSPADGNPFSGPDYLSVGPETVFSNTRSVTITNVSDLSQFYGPAGDSLEYEYSAFNQSTLTVTGAWFGGINASSTLNYKIEFCYCPAVSLPLNVYSFNVNKTSANRAELKWSGTDDPGMDYHYEVEVSRNAYNYTRVGILEKNDNISGNFKMNFSALHGESGVYNFRVKQVYTNGYVRYSTTRQVVLESFEKNTFSIYPNPSNGIVGIKFDNISAEEFVIQIFNTQGQKVMTKDIVVNGPSYVQLGNLTKGVYWVRVTSKKDHASSVQQLITK